MDDEFNKLSDKAKLLYIGLIAAADDQGRYRCHFQLLLGRLFMFDEVVKRQLRQLLDGLAAERFIILYEVDGKEYIQIRDWWRQQVNNRPRPSRHPAPPEWQDKTGFVYLLYDGELYKIGMTSSPDKRLQQLQYQDGREYTMVVSIPTPDHRGLEAQLHKKFKSKRVKGEWFNLDPDDIAWIAALANEEDEE